MPESPGRAKTLWINSGAIRGAWHNEVMAPRFLTLTDVQEMLNISSAQAYSLVRSGDLPAIQVGGRGQWRVEATELEAYIERQYEATRVRLDGTAAHED